MSVLGLDLGYTVKYNPLPSGVPESQKSIDFPTAAFFGQNISAKVRKLRHFVEFEKKCVLFNFFL